MTGEPRIAKSGTGEWIAEEGLSALMREYWRALGGWACLIVASLIAFWLTEGTQYHQLAVGIMMSASTLFILMAIFECIWRLLVGDVSVDDGPDRRRSGA